VKVKGNSSRVRSAQQGISPRLAGVVTRHLWSEWRQPLHGPTREGFAALGTLGVEPSQRIILDSGCGTGESTRLIARAMPDCIVIGIDKSGARLSRAGADRFPRREGNAIWLRGELTTFWRLAVRAGWRLYRHYLLYPNPWPKPRQLQRRWHGHPVFPELFRLGGRLELRSNWEVYALEFAEAAGRVLGRPLQPRPLAGSAVTSPFERKYRASGHPLYSVSFCCDGGGV
jgi:tRNA (guanine-N7-)-methyltransferase